MCVCDIQKYRCRSSVAILLARNGYGVRYRFQIMWCSRSRKRWYDQYNDNNSNQLYPPPLPNDHRHHYKNHLQDYGRIVVVVVVVLLLSIQLRHPEYHCRAYTTTTTPITIPHVTTGSTTTRKSPRTILPRHRFISSVLPTTVVPLVLYQSPDPLSSLSFYNLDSSTTTTTTAAVDKNTSVVTTTIIISSTNENVSTTNNTNTIDNASTTSDDVSTVPTSTTLFNSSRYAAENDNEYARGLLVLLTVPLAWGTYAPVVQYISIGTSSTMSLPPVPGILFSAAYYVVASITLWSTRYFLFRPSPSPPPPSTTIANDRIASDNDT